MNKLKQRGNKHRGNLTKTQLKRFQASKHHISLTEHRAKLTDKHLGEQIYKALLRTFHKPKDRHEYMCAIIHDIDEIIKANVNTIKKAQATVPSKDLQKELNEKSSEL